MLFLQIVCQIIIFSGIINVWVIRQSNRTPYRGSNAKSLKEEFKAYGYSGFFFYLIGFLKLLFSTLLIIGIWFTDVVSYGAIGMIVLMFGAIFSHIKVLDPIKKSLPALVMLLMSTVVLLGHYHFL